MKLSKNKIHTPGYFVKRLRDNGFVVIKLFTLFSKSDPRVWTVLINPGASSVFITCYRNRERYNDIEFELNDGGASIPKNYFIKTDSLEVIIEFLVKNGVSNKDYYPLKDKFLRPRLNIINEPGQQLSA